MMLPSHALAGMALAIPLLVVAPEFATVGFVAGFIGGVFPDLDLYYGHRKTLHYPVYYPALAGIAIAIAVVLPTPATIALALFLAGAALHCLADVFGGGLELRPWEATSDRAVYDHFHGRWLAPRRLVRYDGSIEDLLLSVGLAIPLFVLLDGALQLVVLGSALVATVYVLLRRRLAQLAPDVVRLLPPEAVAYVPRRYREQ